MNENTVVKVVKVAAIAFSVIGMIGSAWAGSKENKLTLAELVNKKFENQ